MSLNLSNSPLAGGGGSRLVCHTFGTVDSSGARKTISVADIGSPFVIYYTNHANTFGFLATATFDFSYLACDGFLINNDASAPYQKIRGSRPELFHEYVSASNTSYYGYMAIPVSDSLIYTKSNSVNVVYVIYVYAE